MGTCRNLELLYPFGCQWKVVDNCGTDQRHPTLWVRGREFVAADSLTVPVLRRALSLPICRSG